MLQRHYLRDWKQPLLFIVTSTHGQANKLKRKMSEGGWISDEKQALISLVVKFKLKLSGVYF